MAVSTSVRGFVIAPLIAGALAPPIRVEPIVTIFAKTSPALGLFFANSWNGFQSEILFGRLSGFSSRLFCIFPIASLNFPPVRALNVAEIGENAASTKPAVLFRIPRPTRAGFGLSRFTPSKI